MVDLHKIFNSKIAHINILVFILSMILLIFSVQYEISIPYFIKNIIKTICFISCFYLLLYYFLIPVWIKAFSNIRYVELRNIVIVFLIIFAVFILCFCFFYISSANSEPIKYSYNLIQMDEKICDYLGNNFKRVGLVHASISRENNKILANFSYKILGEKGISKVNISCIKEDNLWNYNSIAFYYDENNNEFFDLLYYKNNFVMD